MLEKTMKQVLTKKVSAWLATIDDDEVVKAIKKDLIITGGCFTSMILNEEINDFDCYFRTKETVIKVSQYYVDLWNKKNEKQENNLGIKTRVFVLDGEKPSQEILNYYKIQSLQESASRMIANTAPDRVKIIFPSDGIVGTTAEGDPEEGNADEELGTEEGFSSNYEAVTEVDEVQADSILAQEKKDFFPVFMSTNAITLSSGIQIVARFYGEPEQIHDTYDFVHTRAYYDYGNRELVVSKEVYEATINKTLIYTGSKYPVCSLFRLRKFINRGWTINAGQILKISMQVSELDLTNIDVLEDQLIGVDSLYFMQLIEQFRRQQENPEFNLTSTYVMSVVDKIF